MKIALVTGASSGMGREFCRIMDNEFDALWIIARRENRLIELKNQLKTPCKIFPLDLSKSESFEVIENALKEENAEVKCLVNCAGFGVFGRYDEISNQTQQDMIDINVKALVSMCNTCLPFMNKGGRIINLCSSSSFFPLAEFNVYASTKAFVSAYSRALSVELKDRKISVTSVSPGWVETEFFTHAEKSSAKHAPKYYKPMYSAKQVVEKAYKDSKKGKMESVCGLFVKTHKILGKLLPYKVADFVWKTELKK